MIAEISPEMFEHLVKLAAIAFDSREGEYLRNELNNQLKAVHQLESIPLDADVKVTSHGVPYPPETRPLLREDVWEKFDKPEQILKQAPRVEDGYIIVPDIPHTNLD